MVYPIPRNILLGLNFTRPFDDCATARGVNESIFPVKVVEQFLMLQGRREGDAVFGKVEDAKKASPFHLGSLSYTRTR